MEIPFKVFYVEVISRSILHIQALKPYINYDGLDSFSVFSCLLDHSFVNSFKC